MSHFQKEQMNVCHPQHVGHRLLADACGGQFSSFSFLTMELAYKPVVYSHKCGTVTRTDY